MRISDWSSDVCSSDLSDRRRILRGGAGPSSGCRSCRCLSFCCFAFGRFGAEREALDEHERLAAVRLTLEADLANRNGFCEQRPEKGGKLRLKALARLGRGQPAGHRPENAKPVATYGITTTPTHHHLTRYKTDT